MNYKRKIICVILSLLVCAAFAAKKKTVIKLSPEFAEWVYEYVSS